MKNPIRWLMEKFQDRWGQAEDQSQSANDQVIGQIHKNLTIVLVSVVVIGGVVLASLYRQGIIGPIQTNTLNGLVLTWQISDHNDTADHDPLINQLSGTPDNPDFSDVVLELPRESDGSLKTLPRYQGTLEYHKP